MELILTAILIVLIFLGVCKIIKLAKKATIAVICIVLIAYAVVLLMSIDIRELWLELSAWLTGLADKFMSSL